MRAPGNLKNLTGATVDLCASVEDLRVFSPADGLSIATDRVLTASHRDVLSGVTAPSGNHGT